MKQLTKEMIERGAKELFRQWNREYLKEHNWDDPMPWSSLDKYYKSDFRKKAKRVFTVMNDES